MIIVFKGNAADTYGGIQARPAGRGTGDKTMLTRQEAIDYCMTFSGAYEDYPFHDPNWTVMRRRDTHRGFCWIYEHEGKIRLNLKADPGWAGVWQKAYASVLPGYHMNKKYWITVVLDGSVPEETVCGMIGDSYELCGKGPAAPRLK